MVSYHRKDYTETSIDFVAVEADLVVQANYRTVVDLCTDFREVDCIVYHVDTATLVHLN